MRDERGRSDTAGVSLRCVTVDLGTLRRLVAASRLAGCGSWAEAVGKAEDDVRPWTSGIPSGRTSVEVTALVLVQIADAARAVLDAHVPDGALWPQLVGADLREVSVLCG